MTPEEIRSASTGLGRRVPALIPTFADKRGNWLPFIQVARSVWSD
jgi:hypothetical protein